MMMIMTIAMATHVRLALYPCSILSASPVLILAMPTYSLPCCQSVPLASIENIVKQRV